jgi:protein phosphatase PTC7
LEPGDVVVIGSDGLFDNVFVEEMVRIVEKGLAGKPSTVAAMKSAASALLEEAHRNGLNDTFLSPFAREAIAARKAPSNYRGGKPDDISIIVAQVGKV